MWPGFDSGPLPYVGWVCCWFWPFLRVLLFSSLYKNQYFQIPIRPGERICLKPAKADVASSLNIAVYSTHIISFLFRRNSWEKIFSKSTEVISMVIKLRINCQRWYTFTLPTDSHTFLLKIVMRIRLYIKRISPCWWCFILSSPIYLRWYWSFKEKLAIEYLSFILWVTIPKKIAVFLVGSLTPPQLPPTRGSSVF